MDLEKQAALITEYNQWALIQKQVADIGPEAFVIDRAKQAAFDNLQGVLAYLKDELPGLDPEEYTHALVERLIEMIEGDE